MKISLCSTLPIPTAARPFLHKNSLCFSSSSEKQRAYYPCPADFRHRLLVVQTQASIPNVVGQIKAFERLMVKELSAFLAELPVLRKQWMT